MEAAELKTLLCRVPGVSRGRRGNVGLLFLPSPGSLGHRVQQTADKVGTLISEFQTMIFHSAAKQPSVLFILLIFFGTED